MHLFDLLYTLVFFLIIGNTMDGLKTPFKGVEKDLKGRLACYKKDWTDSCGSGARSAFLFALLLSDGEYIVWCSVSTKL